jgi:hypothetical protein
MFVVQCTIQSVIIVVFPMVFFGDAQQSTAVNHYGNSKIPLKINVVHKYNAMTKTIGNTTNYSRLYKCSNINCAM